MSNEVKNEFSFEQALARLEQIVKMLEGGNVPLEDLIKLFDEGSALVKLCTERLDKAEEKVRLLQVKDGILTEEEFSEQ
ncbi:MAG: exodeoxyribonuclease VII small subunit [Clostridia bacterium]|nr:exodeoxyribonuclease VII small subunit [Clostridia bacterium]MBR6755052.1 exodeoxyribonuclease VII small subunit [Clostridia bacterium]